MGNILPPNPPWIFQSSAFRFLPTDQPLADCLPLSVKHGIIKTRLSHFRIESKADRLSVHAAVLFSLCFHSIVF